MTVAPSPNPRFASEATAEYLRAKFAPTYPTIPRTRDEDLQVGRPIIAMSMAALVLVVAVGYGGYTYYSASLFTTQAAPGKTDLPPSPLTEAAEGKGDLLAPASPVTP